jgi:sporulation protein YlmC with PRC-barrel domain
VELGREVLDQQVIDARGVQMGKVDGVILELHAGGPARVAALVVGGTTLWWRIHPALARWIERRRAGKGHAARIPWEQVLKIGVDVKVNVEAERSPALYWERWVRDRIIGRIPGA